LGFGLGLAACAVATCSGSHMNLLLVRALGSRLDIPCAGDAGRCGGGSYPAPTFADRASWWRLWGVWHPALPAPASVRVRVRVRVHALFNPRMSTRHPTLAMPCAVMIMRVRTSAKAPQGRHHREPLSRTLCDLPAQGGRFSDPSLGTGG